MYMADKLSMKRIDSQTFFQNRAVALYDSTFPVAHSVLQLCPQKVSLYTRIKNSVPEESVKNFDVQDYVSAAAAGVTSADICMLDGDSLKALAVRYPSDAQYVLVRLAPRSGWIIGLVRRIVLKRLKLSSLIKIKDTQGRVSWWLLIERVKKVQSVFEAAHTKVNQYERIFWALD